MTDTPIEPALTAEEWAEWGGKYDGLADFNEEEHPTPKDRARMIALANAALPDTDPRKITRRDVAALRDAASACDDTTEPGFSHHTGNLAAIAAALESYLPPE